MGYLRYIGVVGVIGIAGLCSVTADAQFDQTIRVEGKYVPEYVDRDRQAGLGAPVRFPVTESLPEYDVAGVITPFVTRALPMPATGWQDTRELFCPRGSLTLGMGAWLDATLYGHYDIISTGEHTAGVRLAHLSTSLWMPKLDTATEHIRRWLYDDSIGLYYKGHFEGGTLSANADYRSEVYNWYYYVPRNAQGAPLPYSSADVPWMWINRAGGNVDWVSNEYAGWKGLYSRPTSNCCGQAWNGAPDGFGYRAGVEVGYFGYSRKEISDRNETNAKIDGGVSYAWGRNAIVADVSAQALWYSFGTPQFYDITPAYQFADGGFRMRAGAHLDFTTQIVPVPGKEIDPYSTVHISPDVEMEWEYRALLLQLGVTGGTTPYTLALLHDKVYYSTPDLPETTPLYTPVDARISATVGPFNGFSAGVDLAYRINENLRTTTLYRTEYAALPTYPPHYTLRGFSTGVRLGYRYGRWLDMEVGGTYQQQDGTTGYYNGTDRPEWTLSASASTNPWRTLRLKAGYDLRGNRSVQQPTGAYSDGREEFRVWRLKPWSEINLRADYAFNKHIGIWCSASVLTVKDSEMLPGIPVPGYTVLGGLDFNF